MCHIRALYGKRDHTLLTTLLKLLANKPVVLCQWCPWTLFLPTSVSTPDSMPDLRAVKGHHASLTALRPAQPWPSVGAQQMLTGWRVLAGRQVARSISQSLLLTTASFHTLMSEDGGPPISGFQAQPNRTPCPQSPPCPQGPLPPAYSPRGSLSRK